MEVVFLSESTFKAKHVSPASTGKYLERQEVKDIVRLSHAIKCTNEHVFRMS